MDGAIKKHSNRRTCRWCQVEYVSKRFPICRLCVPVGDQVDKIIDSLQHTYPHTTPILFCYCSLIIHTHPSSHAHRLKFYSLLFPRPARNLFDRSDRYPKTTRSSQVTDNCTASSTSVSSFLFLSKNSICCTFI